ncbi:hypothetical protein RHSIM_Rhsim05G0055900 [Rhododendron simsii]|uniref:Uncharacterized protein n=1 Tax=Rhododendron simsii TaxID=118357 RepID=A0A834GWE9_RHOSS|nr:hypothetical protein RHSIM_Rhsim05G0055900 [Rhododendron simsii]
MANLRCQIIPEIMDLDRGSGWRLPHRGRWLLHEWVRAVCPVTCEPLVKESWGVTTASHDAPVAEQRYSTEQAPCRSRSEQTSIVLFRARLTGRPE